MTKTLTQTFETSDALLWEALPDLTLNIAQTAALCGISVRQLGYWTRQGYVMAQGRGSRRTYGLAAVRQVLAIRKAMDGGASLRQALRQVGALEPSAVSSVTASSEDEIITSSSLPPEEEERLTQRLRTFFGANRHVRDQVRGLAVKMGRAEENVLTAAERLCGQGILVKNVCQGMTIFRQLEPADAHVP